MMSFDFNNLNPINKAQAAYKDGGGLGGGGMYMRRNRKRKDQPEDDLFERAEDDKFLLKFCYKLLQSKCPVLLNKKVFS